MPTDDTDLRKQLDDLKAENERLRQQLATATADRDEYRRELFLHFPPPKYTDEEIADFINNRVPADEVLRELRAKYGDKDR